MSKANSKYGIVVALLIGAWFITALSLSAALVFQGGASEAIPRVLFPAVIPLIGFAVWYALSPRFREFVLSWDLRQITNLQSWRVLGFGFLVLGTYGLLPMAFAGPAGWGDLLIGLTAPIAATYFAGSAKRGSFIAWHLLGILDLVTAVTLGVLASPLLHVVGHGGSTAPLTILPLSLIPTFAVPLMLMLHLAAILQARRAAGLEINERPASRRDFALAQKLS